MLTIAQIHQDLIAKKYSAQELTQSYLERVKKENPIINAYLTITEDEAVKSAKLVDQQIVAGSNLPLVAGIPAGIKDVIMTAGVRTTAGSRILENYIAPYDATAVKKLKNQGLVMLGKNNCDEFAMGASNENSAFQPVKNPHDLTRVPGGSSGGSAASVAADLCVYALGSDTGGSIRQPAAFCGVVGLKPTYGSVSRYGLIAMASSLDQIGPIGRCVADVKTVFEVIKGADELDSTSIDNQKSVSTLSSDSLRGIKIGIPKEYFIAGLDTEIRETIKGMIKKAEQLGAEIIDVSLPHTEYALAVYYIIQPAEASANLARYDGIRYGQTTDPPRRQADDKQQKKDLIDIYKKTRAEFLGDEVKRRIMLGTYALSAGYYDAYYKKAQQVRFLIRQDFENVFKEVDYLITPTTPTPAFKLGEKTNDPLTMYLEDVFTVPINLAGVPSISLPVGKNKNGLSIGMQIIGPWLCESNLLAVAQLLEINN